MNIQGNHDEAWLERHLASHNGPRAIRTCAHHLSPLSRQRVVKKKEEKKKDGRHSDPRSFRYYFYPPSSMKIIAGFPSEFSESKI